MVFSPSETRSFGSPRGTSRSPRTGRVPRGTPVLPARFPSAFRPGPPLSHGPRDRLSPFGRPVRFGSFATWLGLAAASLSSSGRPPALAASWFALESLKVLPFRRGHLWPRLATTCPPRGQTCQSSAQLGMSIRSTVFPASACLQSSRNCNRPSRRNRWQYVTRCLFLSS